jgi:hypothetical protein
MQCQPINKEKSSMNNKLIRYVSLMAAVAITPFALLGGLASPAIAHEPTGEYKPFKACPLTVTNIDSCIYSLTTSGEVKIGSTSTPIVNPIVFQGGETREVVEKEIEVEKNGRKVKEKVKEEFRKFVPAGNGEETLVKTSQPVPGGLAGLVKCEEISEPVARLACKLVFENGLTGANATTELVGTAQFSFDELANRHVGLIMPVRLHLENPLLGSKCYIGSESEPIRLEMTTASPGSPGEAKVLNGGALIIAEGDSAFDDSFSVPTANGCGGLLSLAIDPVINAKLGLPSAAGNNSATLNGTLEQASAAAVKTNEEE